MFEDSLQGNVSIGCQSRQVLVACTYGPLFQLKIVDTPCATPSKKLVEMLVESLLVMQDFFLTRYGLVIIFSYKSHSCAH